MYILAIGSLALASSVMAIPSRRGGCDISHAKIDLPPNQTALAVPTTPPRVIGLAIGVQNYTCTAATSKWASVGALATLVDASCLACEDEFKLSDAATAAYDVWKGAGPGTTPESLLSMFHLPILGQHYFVTNPVTGVGISPKWDFTAAKGPNAFVVASKVAGLPAPTGPGDVDWLQLKNIAGGLADAVYRVDTRGGPSPASCTPATDVSVLSVKYSAVYWFYGGTAPLNRK